MTATIDQPPEHTPHAIDRARERAATMAHEAAELLYKHPPGHGRAAEVTELLAGRMDRTSGYLRASDAGAIRRDVRGYVIRHPVHAVAAGVISGYVVSRLLSR